MEDDEPGCLLCTSRAIPARRVQTPSTSGADRRAGQQRRESRVLLQLAEMVEILDRSSTTISPRAKPSGRIWNARQQINPGAGRAAQESVRLRTSRCRSRCCRRWSAASARWASSTASRCRRSPAPATAAWWRAGVRGGTATAGRRRRREIFRDAPVELGGTISAEHGLGALKRDFASLEHSAEEIAWWRKLQDLYDPLGRFRPTQDLPRAARRRALSRPSSRAGARSWPAAETAPRWPRDPSLSAASGLPEAPDTLETQRLILRRITEPDVDHIARIPADPEVMHAPPRARPGPGLRSRPGVRWPGC